MEFHDLWQEALALKYKVMALFQQEFEDDAARASAPSFEEVALAVFHLQAKHNTVYREWLHHLGTEPAAVHQLSDIPYLPIEVFKHHRVSVFPDSATPVQVFESSGTTSSTTSRHYLYHLEWYQTLATLIFERQVANLDHTDIIALLPGYLDRPNSSLIAMLQHFIKLGHAKVSGFYKTRDQAFTEALTAAIDNPKRATLIWGVTHSLVKWAQEGGVELPYHVRVLETGGMKGHGRERVRQELHEELMQAFQVPSIMGEYGMTELLSQAYSQRDGLYVCPPSMRVTVREQTDPKHLVQQGVRGLLNVIDLGNVDSCSFIATQDIGQVVAENEFLLLGRADHADVRGCNLLVD